MTYCTLEEAWGIDFKRKHKKSKRERKYEKQDKRIKEEAIDSKILIPESHNNEEYRKTYNLNDEINSSIMAYDSDNLYGSPYNIRSEIEKSNERILTQKKESLPQINNNINNNINNDMIQISKKEYLSLKNNSIEGFTNMNDDQFNLLLLYVFTGILYLFMLDMMYQLGKKSY